MSGALGHGLFGLCHNPPVLTSLAKFFKKQFEIMEFTLCRPDAECSGQTKESSHSDDNSSKMVWVTTLKGVTNSRILCSR